MFFFVCVVTLAALLSACGGGGGDTPSTTTTTPPATAIKTTIDEQNRVTAVIPPTGGTITTTGQDGTKYTLTFPTGSTATEIQVSLAPVISITGLVFDPEFVAAVDMTPDGHQFQSPITLTIELPAPLVGNGFPVGIHIASNGTDSSLLPTQTNGNIYTIELEHFSAAGLWEVTEENVHQYILDKFYGPLGIVKTLNDITKCSDYRFDLLVNKAVDLVKAIRTVDGFIHIEEETINPPRQCTGYIGIVSECSSLDQLQDAAIQNLDDALLYFTNEAIQQCSAGDPAQEAEAFECIRKGFWLQEKAGFTFHPDLAGDLCQIKAKCGIATLVVQPNPLILAVSESQQLMAIPRDLAGNVLVDREIAWLPLSNSNIAQLSDISVANPYATGLSPGYTNTIVADTMGQLFCPGISSNESSIHVTNEFITSAESIIVPEGETTALQVKLAYPPEIGVTANVSRISGDTDLTVASGETLDFKPDNWDIYQTVLFFAYEDDQDIENGTAVFEIKDTYFWSSLNARVSPKEILAKESDNDGPSMFVTPDTLCVEAGRTASLSIIANQFVDLNAIRWSSSDISVATVDSAGQVSAQSAGPVRITADLISNQDVLASAFATLEVRNSCAIIATPDYPKKRKMCIHAALSPAFETENDRIQVDAIVRTPQDGSTIIWGTDSSSTITVELIDNDEDSARVHGITGGTGTVELTVNNVVTEYHASLPIDVVRLPDGYKGVGLTLPFVAGKPHALKDNREIVPYTELEQTLTDAVVRCGLDSESMLDRMTVTNWHESGKVIGVYVSDTSNNPGFVFDLNTCDLDFFSAPLQTPAGDDMVSETRPTSISADGTIVGVAHWHVYGDWCDQNPDYSCTYTVDTGFVLQNGMFSFPFLVPFQTPYAEPYYFTRLDAINDDRTALFYSSQSNSSALYNLDDSTFKLVPEGYRALNDHEHVVGTNFSPWFFSNAQSINLMPQFASGTSPSILFPDQINEAEDILASGGDQGSSFEHFLLYLCPPSVENKTALFVDDRNVIEGYEQSEISCDGRDNDLDGLVDIALEAPLTTKQAGVCAGAVQICGGRQGWIDDYSGIPNYEFPEVSCDNLDNDCDAIKDEGCPTVAATQ